MSRNLSLAYFVAISFVLTVYSCAQMAVPNGGEKDITAPQLDNDRTFPVNKSVNFTSSHISLVFDEYVKLNNPNQQIIISPAPEVQPEYLLKGKTLLIQFKKPLKPNTTYTINFGGGITDITEGNAAVNLQYVFSTGAILDSMSYSGVLNNAYTLAPEKGVLIALYENTDDSVVMKSKPDYFAVSDAGGQFSIQNVKSGTYKVVALRDNNSNYLYDLPAEEIAFRSENLVLDENGIHAKDKLTLFKEDRDKFYVKKKSIEAPGKITFIFSRKSEDTSSVATTQFPYSQWLSADTLIYWLKADEKNTISGQFNFSGIEDSVIYQFSQREIDTYFKKPLRIKSNVLTGAMDLNGKLSLSFDAPLLKFDVNKIHVHRDTSELKMNWTKRNKLAVLADYSFLSDEKTNYSVVFEKGAVQNIYNQENEGDTIKFQTQKLSYYGILLFTVNTSFENYILQITNEKGETIREFPGSGKKQFKFEYLRPGTYKARIVIDQNKNNKWDSGNYLEHIQPEKIIYFNEVISIRSNWDLELEWNLK